MNKFKKIIIIITVIAFLITASFFGGLFWIRSKAAAESNKQEKQEEIHIISYEMNDAIIVNIMSSNKMLRVKPILKLKNGSEEDVTFLTKYGFIAGDGKNGGGTVSEGVLKPSFYSVLRNKTLEAIQEPNSHIEIGKEITEVLNKAFDTEAFINVEFSEFIYQ